MKTEPPQFFIGTSGWVYHHWKGLFYPLELPQTRWFEYYTTHFSSVEINATFYRSFGEQTFVKWREKAPPGFRYVLKAPRVITHRKYLEGVEEDIARFWTSATRLEERLGMILLQIAPGTPYEPARLHRALSAFPEPSKVAVEFRRKEWYSDEILALLRSMGATFCHADSPRTRLHEWLTSTVGYIRLHGRKRWYAYLYSDEELRQIARLAQGMVEAGAQNVYIFFNNDFEGYAPQNALSLKEILFHD